MKCFVSGHKNGLYDETIQTVLTWSFLSGSYLLAKPKSITLIRLPSRVKHKMFSGFKSKCRILLLCINSIASQSCRIRTVQVFSVNTNSSSMTRSKSSPPSMLFQESKTKKHTLNLPTFELSKATHEQYMICIFQCCCMLSGFQHSWRLLLISGTLSGQWNENV